MISMQIMLRSERFRVEKKLYISDMNLEYLVGLVDELSDLWSKDFLKADKIKYRAVEAFKVLFSNEIVMIGTISRLSFNGYDGTTNHEIFNKSKIELINLLEAKIETLKYKRSIAAISSD